MRSGIKAASLYSLGGLVLAVSAGCGFDGYQVKMYCFGADGVLITDATVAAACCEQETTENIPGCDSDYECKKIRMKPKLPPPEGVCPKNYGFAIEAVNDGAAGDSDTVTDNLINAGLLSSDGRTAVKPSAAAPTTPPHQEDEVNGDGTGDGATTDTAGVTTTKTEATAQTGGLPGAGSGLDPLARANRNRGGGLGSGGGSGTGGGGGGLGLNMPGAGGTGTQSGATAGAGNGGTGDGGGYGSGATYGGGGTGGSKAYGARMGGVANEAMSGDGGSYNGPGSAGYGNGGSGEGVNASGLDIFDIIDQRYKKTTKGW